MNREHPSGDDDASFAQLAAIDEICDRFEEAWRGNSTARRSPIH
jgi:hypothetical protein